MEAVFQVCGGENMNQPGLPPSRTNLFCEGLKRISGFAGHAASVVPLSSASVERKQPYQCRSVAVSDQTLFTKTVGRPDLACGSQVCQSLLRKANWIKFKCVIQDQRH